MTESNKLGRLGDVATFIVVACVVVLTGFRVNDWREGTAKKRAASGAPGVVKEWRKYGSVGRRVGPVDAKVTIVEFADFQCPYCKVAADSIAMLLAKYPNDLALVYRHLPLTRIHPFARTAALASECAADDGKFSAFHAKLYQRSDSLGKVNWATMARESGVENVPKFESCLRDSTFKANVDRDVASAAELGIQGTPGFLLNEKQFRGFPGLKTMEADIVAAGAKK